MRIISGTARGRKLAEPAGYETRPTTGMVKESIFNMIQFDVEGRKVLDLFAGTGQLGIEALSRGAKSAVFVDLSPDAAKLIRQNLIKCGLSDSATVYTRDAIKFIANEGNINEKFDLVFIDPPYGSALANEAIQKIIKIDKLDTNGIIICELSAEFDIPAVSLPYFLCKSYNYGRVRIARYSRGHYV